MYSMLTIVNNIVLRAGKLLRVDLDLKGSHHIQQMVII